MTAKNTIQQRFARVHAQAGISLVEILVALSLSVVLMAGVGQIYLGSKQTYRLQDGQSRLLENARYALDVLSQDIRRAGSMGRQSVGSFIPPATQQDSNNLLNNDLRNINIAGNNLMPQVRPAILANGPLLAPNNAANAPAGVVLGPAVSGGDNAVGGVYGSFLNPNPALSNDLNNVVVKGTDAITIQFAESCGLVTNAGISTVAGVKDVLPAANSPCSKDSSGPLLISNWRIAHIFRTDGNNAKDIEDTYPAGAEIMRFRAYTYYIGCNNQVNPGRCAPDGGNYSEPSLYRYDNTTNNSDELVEGVEDMQITYGVDTSNDGLADQYYTAGDNYLSAADPAHWAQVVTVRINLTVRSVGFNADNLTSQPNIMRPFNSANRVPNLVDSRLVKNFSISINLRR